MTEDNDDLINTIATKELMDDGYTEFIFQNRIKILRFKTPGDGSCFFHSIINAFYIPYRLRSQPRHLIVRQFRIALATKLTSRIKSKDNKTYYQVLSDGQLPILAKNLPEYSLENLQKQLLTINSWVTGYFYQEYISDLLDKDIYILDNATQDVVLTHKSDKDMLYKGRNSIVIIFLDGHYELVGIREGGSPKAGNCSNPEIPIFRTHFPYDHPFIQLLSSCIDNKGKS